MAKIRYTGNAINQKQVATHTVASPTAGASIYTVLCNGKTFSYTAVTSVAATEAESIADAFNGQSNIRELLDIIADNPSGAIVTFTSRTEGVPFTATIGVTGGGTFNGSTTTANSGSGVLSLADNWSASISSSDDLIIDKPNINVQYLLTSLTTSLTSVSVPASFNGELGLPIQNVGGYPEYRPCFARFVCPLFNIGAGNGPGAARCYIEGNAGAAMNVYVFNTGTSQDGYPACLLRHVSGGSNSFTTIRVISGDVGIAYLPDDVATVTNLVIGDDSTTPTVQCGVGCTLTNLTISSGSASLVSNPSGTTIITGGAEVITSVGGAATLIQVLDGRMQIGGTGTSQTITNLTVGAAGILDLSYGHGTVTVSNAIKLHAGYTIIDPLNRLASSTTFTPQDCMISDGTMLTSKGLTWTKS